MGLELAFPGTIIQFMHNSNVAYVQTVPNILCMDDPRFFWIYPGGIELCEGYAAEKETTKL